MRTAKELQRYFNTDDVIKTRFRELTKPLQKILGFYGYLGTDAILDQFDKKTKTISFVDPKFKVRITFHDWYVENPTTDISDPVTKDSKPKTATERSVKNMSSVPYTAKNSYEISMGNTTEDNKSWQNEGGFTASSSFTGGLSGATESSFGATALVTVGLDISYLHTALTAISKIISEEQSKMIEGEMVVPPGKRVRFLNLHDTCKKELKITISGTQNCKVTLDLTKAPDNPDDKGNIFAIERKVHTANSIEAMCALLLGCQGNVIGRKDIFDRAIRKENKKLGEMIEILLDKSRRVVEETNTVTYDSADNFVTQVEEEKIKKDGIISKLMSKKEEQ